MKKIDVSETGLFEMSWSPDGNWLAYVRGEDEICKASVDGGSPVAVTRGFSPCFNADNHLVFERNDEIYLHADGREQVIVSKDDLVAGSAKRKPKTSFDGKKMVFVVDNVFHKESENKNAYPFRSFLGVADASTRAQARILGNQQWYGGTITWFPNNETFLHYEFDSTGGARIHMTNLEGEKRGTIFGLFPSISPDEKRIACKPKGGQSVVVYMSKSDVWDLSDVETVVTKLPEGGRLSGSAPIWIDNRFVLIDEGGKLFRVDTRKQETTEMKKIPTPVFRGTHTMAVSPSREQIAVETESEGGFELCIAPLA
ncbi:MAG: PD40 domain-containing protein [Deltaproteobacteria bacterium]|nr:PD40 domain-containing protein [Deltaproteobacteria bacterium]MBN2671813.1 PD40 domain-containing protein [Deltaproteobacteria bacterium]